jgi:hypothetical protein
MMTKRDPAIKVLRRHALRAVFGDRPYDAANTLAGGAVPGADGTPIPGQRRKKKFGKQPRVLKVLADKFGRRCVPDPGEYPRKQLIDEILKADPSLKVLSWDTLNDAIIKHNSERFGSSRTNSDF